MSVCSTYNNYTFFSDYDKLVIVKNTGFSTVCCRKCLYISLLVADMLRFARMVDPDYDIYKRNEYREGYPIGNKDAASRIVIDMLKDGHYVEFNYLGELYPF
jgi:hypothetical protein